ncbi:MAG TPA: acyl-CoA dehydrogenase family protein [Dehalococcoidia bacterium]|nr:acyl-CoA dehydrogenase family protein [Dehalococcoidia bacterium]
MLDLTSLTDEQRQILQTVKDWVAREVMPVAHDMEHDDIYPHDLVEQMKAMGLFGVIIPEEYGGLGLSFTTYALIVEEICRAWMSLTGILNSHTILAYTIWQFGTEDQKRRYLPDLCAGRKRGGLALTEPNAGTDVQAIRTTARREGDFYLVNGNKMFITNGLHGNTFALAAKTDTQARPAYRGISLFIAEKGHEGFTVGRELDKLGYKGLDTVELNFDNFPVPADCLIGGVEGQGFKQVMGGLEVGRINVAARGVGVARAAFEDALRYAQQRQTMGKPIAEHQAIQLKLADMATKVEASRLLVLSAAQKKDRGERCDLEAGMAKLFATETCAEVALESMRIHGGYGYTKEMNVERYYRDAPLMIIGEGTNEIQRIVIARQLLKEYPV